jgi:hypothetical protein
MPSLANVVLLGGLVTGGLLAANNVFGDASDAIDLAGRVACGSAPCKPEIAWHRRGPIRQRLQFLIDGKSSVEVQCQRVFWLVGAFDCFEVRVDDRNSDDFRF